MQGIYKITIGDLVYEYKNIITDSGKLALLKAIAGQRQGWALSIGAGIGAATATASDQSLSFAASGGDVTTTIVDPINEKIFFKASLPVLDQCTIYELGCYGTVFTSVDRSENGGGVLLANTSTDQQWIDTVGTSLADTTNSRIGINAISYDILATDTAKGYVGFLNDLSHIPNDASFKFAYFCENIAEFIIRFKVDDSNYYETDTLAVTDGYNIDAVLKSAFVATGTPSWTDIQYLEFEAEATASNGKISLDALRYELPFTGESNLLSRVVLVTPQAKLPGLTLDLEYQLELSL